MPLNRYVVRVDPQGQTVVVDVLDTSGASVVAYESPQFAAATLALPLTITAPTDFWLHDSGPYDVSCKVGGAEVADAGAPKRVQVSDVPVLVVPDWARERTAASSGGSIQVRHVAFSFAFDTPGLDTGLTIPGYTPAVGDVLYDGWFQLETIWDVAAAADLGQFGHYGSPNYGLFSTAWGQPNGLSGSPDGAAQSMPPTLRIIETLNVLTNASLITVSGGTHLAGTFIGPLAGPRAVPNVITSTDPFKVCVSGDGSTTGGPVVATQGAATVHLLYIPAGS